MRIGNDLSLPESGDLAEFLGVKSKTLWFLAYRGDRLYREFTIPKRSGGVRPVRAPVGVLKDTQRAILDKILAPAMAELPDYIVGFRPGYSIKTGASQHVDACQLVKFDISEFFETVDMRRVYWVFNHMLGMDQSSSWALARICTYRREDRRTLQVPYAYRYYDRHCYGMRVHRNAMRRKAAGTPEHKVGRYHGIRSTPQGSPASPAIANLAAYRLHRRLNGLAQRLDMSYTAYADDLVFSRPKEAGMMGTRSIRKFKSTVRKIIVSERFTTNQKGGDFRRNARLEVTGIVVNEKTNVTKEYYRTLRASMHALHVGKPCDPVNVIRGRFEFLRMVNPDRAESLLKKYPVF